MTDDDRIPASDAVETPETLATYLRLRGLDPSPPPSRRRREPAVHARP